MGDREGLPWWGAVLLALGLSLVGAFVNMWFQESLGIVFQVCYFVSCVAAVCAVRRGNLFAPMVQPPLILAATVPTVVLLGSGLPEGSDGFAAVLTIGTPLINGFPIMAIATIVTVAIGVLRIYRERDPEAPVKTGKGAKRKPASGDQRGPQRARTATEGKPGQDPRSGAAANERKPPPERATQSTRQRRNPPPGGPRGEAERRGRPPEDRRAPEERQRTERGDTRGNRVPPDDGARGPRRPRPPRQPGEDQRGGGEPRPRRQSRSDGPRRGSDGDQDIPRRRPRGQGPPPRRPWDDDR